MWKWAFVVRLRQEIFDINYDLMIAYFPGKKGSGVLFSVFKGLVQAENIICL